METQKTPNTQVAKTFIRKKNGAAGIMLPDFGLQYKAIVTKSVWQWHKNRHILHEQSETGSPEINIYTYGQLIYGKGGKNTQWKKRQLLH